MAALSSAGADLTLTNTNYVTMTESDTNPLTTASPYPSSITVSGLTGQVITHLAVTLNGFSHSFPSDANVLLAGPSGQTAVLMAGAGGQDDFPVTNLTMSFDDDSPTHLPILDSLYSGAFQPGAFSLPLDFDFPSPAPPGNSNSPAALSIFNNTDPDGVWRLYVLDNFPGTESGSISGGWTLDITTGVPLSIHPVGTNYLAFSWPIVSGQTFVLQSTLNLIDSNGWSNVSGSPVQLGGFNVLSNATSQSNKIKYFRLLGQ